MKPYLWLGYICQLLGAVIQVLTLPFADMTLLAVCCVAGTLFTQILSMLFLGEIFTFKYDLTALLLLPTGSMMLVFVSNLEPKTIDAELIQTYLYTRHSLYIVLLILMLQLCSELTMRHMFKMLDNFYIDAEQEDERIRELEDSEKRYLLPSSYSKKLNKSVMLTSYEDAEESEKQSDE